MKWILMIGVNGNGFTLVGESGQPSAMSHRLEAGKGIGLLKLNYLIIKFM